MSPSFNLQTDWFFPGGIFSAETTEGAGLSPSRMDFKCMNLEPRGIEVPPKIFYNFSKTQGF